MPWTEKKTVFVERILKKTSLQFKNDYWEVTLHILSELENYAGRRVSGGQWRLINKKKPSYWQVCITRTHSLSVIIFWETLYTAHLSTLTTRNCLFSLSYGCVCVCGVHILLYQMYILICTGVRINATK